MEIYNLEDKVIRERERESRRIKTIHICFLLYDIPEVQDVEKKRYNNNLSSFLHSKLDFLKNGHVQNSKEGFHWC